MDTNLPPTESFNAAAPLPPKYADILDLPGRPRSLVSLNSVLRTGEFDIYNRAGHAPLWSLPLTDRTLFVDLKADDPYTRALNDIEKTGRANLLKDQTIRELLDKPAWDGKDRWTWERALATHVVKSMAVVPGLDEYRTGRQTGPARPFGVTRTPRLNDLNEDMIAALQDADSKYKVEFDCEHMAATAGLVMQRLENDMLGKSGPEAGLKQAAPYYFVGANLAKVLNYDPGVILDNKASHDYVPPDIHIGGHAFLMSSATGAVIDATASYDLGTKGPQTLLPPKASDDARHPDDLAGSVYLGATVIGYDFQEFVRSGKAVFGNVVYGVSKDPQDVWQTVKTNFWLAECSFKSGPAAHPQECGAEPVRQAFERDEQKAIQAAARPAVRPPALGQ